MADSQKRLSHVKLADLTNLRADELERFKCLWSKIAAGRRTEVVRRLMELAEENFELNFDSIFKLSLGDEDETVRSTAIEGLWENEEPSCINPLIALMERDSSENVQTTAAIALGKYVMLAECGKLRPQYGARLQESLLAVAKDRSRPVEVSRRALEAVAPFSVPEVKDAIMAAYRNADSRFKASSLYAMGINCDPSWLRILLQELESPDAELRYEAVGACGELESEEAVPDLERLVSDDDTSVQVAAVRALGKIGGKRARRFLESCLESSSELIVQEVEQALREAEDKEKLSTFEI